MRSALRVTSLLLLSVVSIAVAQAPSAKATTKTAPDPKQELINVEQQLIQAEKDGDRATLDKLFAAEFVAVNGKGMLLGRGAFLGYYKPGMFRYITFESPDARIYGDVGVVLGISRQKTTKDGPEDKVRFTDIWAKRDGRWQLVVSHFSNMEPLR